MAALDDPDVIVIGSGFGGSVIAARLVEAGHKVVLLERGPWRDTEPVRSAGIAPRKPLPRTGGYFSVVRSIRGPKGPKRGIVLNKYGHFEFWHGQGISAPCGSGVGGGSHIWAAMMDRPAAGFWDNRADCLSDAAMAPHYSRCLAELQAVQPPDPATVPGFTGHAWRDSGFFTPLAEGEQPPMGLLYPDASHGAPVTDSHGITRHPVDYANGPGKFGDPVGAKSTTDVLYLLPALRQGLTVLDMHEVRAIRREAAGFALKVRDLRRWRSRWMRAPRVVLAAGVMNTNSLLRRAVDAGDLPDMPALGRGIGANGDLIGGWPVPADGSVDASFGLPVHGRVKIKGHEEAGYFILSGGEPEPMPWFLKTRAAARARSKFNVIAMGQDNADGRFWSDAGRHTFTFDASKSPSYTRAAAALDALAQMSGRPVKYSLSPLFTAHPMGGCRISDDPATGVVDGVGRVHGLDGLVICDAAVFPQPVGVPPSLSIAAFASFAAEALIARLNSH